MILHNGDCLEVMKNIKDKSIDFILTDIPYAVVSRESNGLRNLDKDKADILSFDLDKFLDQCLRVCKGSICIFCGKEQFSDLYKFFAAQKGTVRPIVWQKSNPSPMNGQHIYLSGVEFAVWFKPKGHKTFNAHCKNTVFKYPNGNSKIHPTSKNLNLFEELISDNTNENDIVLDPCMGGGTTGVACRNLNRDFIGIELDETYFDIAKQRIG